MEGGGGEGSGSPGSLEAQEPKTRPAHVNSIRKLEVRILYPLFAIQDYAGLGLWLGLAATKGMRSRHANLDWKLQ